MGNLKHGFSSSKLYELLINIEFKGDTTLDLNNFYNHIKIFLNAVNRLLEDLNPDFGQSKDTLSLKNNPSQIMITLPIIGMHRPTLTFEIHCWWHLLTTPV